MFGDDARFSCGGRCDVDDNEESSEQQKCENAVFRCQMIQMILSDQNLALPIQVSGSALHKMDSKADLEFLVEAGALDRVDALRVQPDAGLYRVETDVVRIFPDMEITGLHGTTEGLGLVQRE